MPLDSLLAQRERRRRTNTAGTLLAFAVGLCAWVAFWVAAAIAAIGFVAGGAP
jgi:hypothetical protein